MGTSIDWDRYFDALARDLGGTLLSARPQVRNSGGRTSFFVDIEVGGDVRRLYVRAGRDMAPAAAAYRDLQKEKTVMDWLAARDVPVARAVHLSKEPVALAMEAIAGEDDFERVNTTPDGEAILSHYIEILADMHRHEVSELSAAGFRTPSGDTEIALHHFQDFAVAIYRMSGTPPNPLCHWGADWMTRHAPRGSGRVSLIQGDTGPGNFVYVGQRVQALVDWELAHLGDPMEDLGVLRLRDVWTPFPGGFRKYLDEYQTRSGTEINDAAIRWYSIKLCIVHPHVLAIPVYHPAVSTTPAEWVAEYYSLSRLGLEEIGAQMGITLEKPELPAARMTLQSHYHDVLTTALRDEVIAHIGDDYHRYRAEQAWRVAQYLRGADRYLDAIHEMEMDEIGTITAQRARDHGEAIAQLHRYVEQATPEADEPLLRFFYRQQYRMEALMPGAIGRSEGRSFTPLD